MSTLEGSSIEAPGAGSVAWVAKENRIIFGFVYLCPSAVRCAMWPRMAGASHHPGVLFFHKRSHRKATSFRTLETMAGIARNAQKITGMVKPGEFPAARAPGPCESGGGLFVR